MQLVLALVEARRHLKSPSLDFSLYSFNFIRTRVTILDFVHAYPGPG